jgi:hypothetical protein
MFFVWMNLYCQKHDIDVFHFHYKEGPFTGKYPRWEFGDPESDKPFSHFVVEIFDRAEHPALIMNNDTWATYQAHEDGKHATTERAYAVFKRNFQADDGQDG